MIEPIYVDLHIHTSNNPNDLEINYDVKTLIDKIKKYNGDSQYLISLTDHNTINKIAYENLDKSGANYILGTELHIRNYPDANLYHAHIYFNAENKIECIDNINNILDELYPEKIVSKEMEKVPSIEDIIRSLDEYDFILLPHGGQNHSTFNGSIPKGRSFDSTMERTIYYNQFDGFTARGNSGVEETISYFKKLNINEFINLLTGSDNYSPSTYPNPKSGESSNEFVPTWMIAEPTFEGVRLSLSEKNRLYYKKEKPEMSSQIIKRCKLNNHVANINVNFTNGLNVIIGESSSGKSLLIDSLFKKLDNNDFTNSNYNDFEVKNIIVDNPFNFKPHYINQNFIVEKINNKKIGDIEIIRLLFPSNQGVKQEVKVKLQELQTIISNMLISVKEIESLKGQIEKISIFTKLIYEGEIQDNPAYLFQVNDETDKIIKIEEVKYQNYDKVLDEIKKLSIDNPYMFDLSIEIEKVKSSLKIARDKYQCSESIQLIITESIATLDEQIVEINGELAIKKQEKESLIDKTKKYIREKRKFDDSLTKLLQFDYKIETQKTTCGGHKLSILNEFKITNDVVLEIINNHIKKEARIKRLDDLKSTTLFSENFSQRPKVNSYEDLSTKIYNEFVSLNEEKYSIITKDGKDFDTLSPGWKTAIILDLVFSSKKDNAPLLIDQPEDNLASTYLNAGLIKSIHRVKKQRQIIIVSHNATIPMLGDAQNVIVCQNKAGLITIKNAALEAKIDGNSVVDSVANLTDGGKTSIKKRFKKYNLKKYKGEKNDEIDN